MTKIGPSSVITWPASTPVSTVSVARAVPACKSHDDTPPPATQTPHYFTDDERKALGALADAIIPPDGDPGGKDLGAVPYLEQLLTAFESDPPKVFAGGPFSGRAPNP